MANILKDIANNSLKLTKTYPIAYQYPIQFNVNVLFYSNDSQYSGAINACTKLYNVKN